MYLYIYLLLLLPFALEETLPEPGFFFLNFLLFYQKIKAKVQEFIGYLNRRGSILGRVFSIGLFFDRSTSFSL